MFIQVKDIIPHSPKDLGWIRRVADNIMNSYVLGTLVPQ